jgi:hypothetical protein
VGWSRMKKVKAIAGSFEVFVDFKRPFGAM